jgi:hypothetical protein
MVALTPGLLISDEMGIEFIFYIWFKKDPSLEILIECHSSNL